MVLSNKLWTPQTFLEVITDKCYIINGDNDAEFIHDVLRGEGFEDDDCKDCVYSEEYHLVDGECVLRSFEPTEAKFEPPTEVSRQC